MKKLNPEILEFSPNEKDRFDEVCKELYAKAFADPVGYNAFISEIKKIEKSVDKSRVGVEISKFVNKYIYKNVKLSKKLSYFLIIPSVSMYISNTYVYNPKVFEQMRTMNYAYFIQYINLVAMFALTRNTKERNEIKKDLNRMDKGLEVKSVSSSASLAR